MIPIFHPLCKRRVNCKKNKDTSHYAESYRKCKPQPLHPNSGINSWDKICICRPFFQITHKHPLPSPPQTSVSRRFPNFHYCKGQGREGELPRILSTLPAPRNHTYKGYCITVPRTFVQKMSIADLTLPAFQIYIQF